jgi:hypothetical protein
MGMDITLIISAVSSHRNDRPADALRNMVRVLAASITREFVLPDREGVGQDLVHVVRYFQTPADQGH